MDTWMSQPATPAARAELAPSGKLRVGINHSNFLLVNPGSPHGAPKGIAPDLGADTIKFFFEHRYVHQPLLFIAPNDGGLCLPELIAGVGTLPGSLL